MNIECSICLLEIEHWSQYKTTCNHYFHSKCIMKWKGSNFVATCPICRARINSIPEKYRRLDNADILKALIEWNDIPPEIIKDDIIWVSVCYPGKSLYEIIDLLFEHDNNVMKVINNYIITMASI